MNREQLKTYAPQARRDFIQAMKDRADFYGLTAERIDPVVERGDVAIVSGREHPRSVARKRQKLESRIRRDGFDQTMEGLAYIWFNRLVAIRFMELNGFLDHGFRVLSHPDGGLAPEILEQAENANLPGLKTETIIDLKLAANRESELYRRLLIGQCNALSVSMPFLFEEIDDETELMIPENLLHTDSVVRKLVKGIDPTSWKDVEIIGWLYQYYISERKDEVIGKVIASEDIPAATQLFTPNWIVKYLVQNTLGRRWLSSYPASNLRSQMAYFIEPAKQSPEVCEQIRVITPEALDPEQLTFMDPACGSGHILVEAYELFKSIYIERGYRPTDIPSLILQKNLFGLEIDERAAQLAAFALLMKARGDDRQIFNKMARPNVYSFQEDIGVTPTEMADILNDEIGRKAKREPLLFDEIEDRDLPLLASTGVGVSSQFSTGEVSSVISLFESSKTFGSLIKIPKAIVEKIQPMINKLRSVQARGDLFSVSLEKFSDMLRQACFLGQKYDVVVANPPYMGNKYYPKTLKKFVDKQYKPEKSDLYACFINRNLEFSKLGGLIGMITIPNWMFLSSFEEMRISLLAEKNIESFIHNGRGVFGSDFGSCAFVIRNLNVPNFQGSYRRLFNKQGEVNSNEELSRRFFVADTHTVSTDDLSIIDGAPLAYWVTPKIRKLFASSLQMGKVLDARQGLATSENNRFLRLWYEVEYSCIKFGIGSTDEARLSKFKWFPYNKGGEFRRWYGNREYVVNWLDDGKEIKEIVARKYPYLNGNIDYVVKNRDYYFREAVSWSDITISENAFRYYEHGFIFDACAHSAFATDREFLFGMLAFLNNTFVSYATKILNQSVHFHVGYFKKIPFPPRYDIGSAANIAREAIELSRADWDSFETSWDFSEPPMCRYRSGTVSDAANAVERVYDARFNRMKELEKKNNLMLIEAFDLQHDLSADVEDYQISLNKCDIQREIRNLISYSLGCAVGRFFLKPYGQHASNGTGDKNITMFDDGLRRVDDGIITVVERDWELGHDAAQLCEDFIGRVWPNTERNSNISYIADCIDSDGAISMRERIRRYCAMGLFKDHIISYKRRPIYWLFTSGKYRAFQALVYLHHYNEGTLARMRTEYVIPLQGKLSSRIDQLEGDKAFAASTSHRRKMQKEQEDLKKQQAELFTFEEKLKHYADQRISLDLDDGVKINYGKFGDLLAEVKAITGDKDET